MESPETDVVVPLNSNGVFVCKTEIFDPNLGWLIKFPGMKNFALLSLLTNQSKEERGVVVTATNTMSTLSISGLSENNNTFLYCTITGGDTTLTVSFIVFGEKRTDSSVQRQLNIYAML